MKVHQKLHKEEILIQIAFILIEHPEHNDEICEFKNAKSKHERN